MYSKSEATYVEYVHTLVQTSPRSATAVLMSAILRFTSSSKTSGFCDQIERRADLSVLIGLLWFLLTEEVELLGTWPLVF